MLTWKIAAHQPIQLEVHSVIPENYASIEMIP